MPSYMIVALTNPVPGHEDEFNDWYDTVATPIYRQVPGCNPLGRFKIADLPRLHTFSSEHQWQYLSLYQVESDDIETKLKEMAEFANRAEGYYMSDAIDRSRFYEPVFMKLE